MDFEDRLRRERSTWLVTGAAGFIGSHLIEFLLANGQEVRGYDNLASGKKENLELVRRAVGEAAWAGFRFHQADILDPAALASASTGVHYVLHEAANASASESFTDPEGTLRTNVIGTRNVFAAATKAGVKRVMFASSAAVYGDDPAEEKREAVIGKPLSPYGEHKRQNELDAAEILGGAGVGWVGLRYFNVYGSRQDPHSNYSGVISIFLDRVCSGQPATIFGDGRATRDFVHVSDIVRANVAAAFAPPAALGRAYNVGTGRSVGVRELLQVLQDERAKLQPPVALAAPVFQPERRGDIRSSQAGVALAAEQLGFRATTELRAGLAALLRARV